MKTVIPKHFHYFRLPARLSSHKVFKPALFILAFAALGTVLIFATRAATPFASIEPEGGSKTANIITINGDSTASGGSAVQFGNGAPSGWPNASNSGVLVATNRTIAGADITSASWFGANGFPGAGTQDSPYLVDRVLFTVTVSLGDWSPTDLTGKWVKFTNCRFYGVPSNPTVGGSTYINNRDTGPFLIVEDSTLAPNQAPLATGGTSSGTDKGILSYVPFQLRRSNVYGAAILVYFEIERSETTGVVIEDNYLHDIWSSSGDHTDIINGNFHASHVVARHNYMDGIRVGNSYVTNAFGIYDDPSTSSAGIIEDWIIDNNYIDRSATMILASDSTARFLNPFVVTNNTFTDRFTVTRFSARTPSTQSGNKDQNGNPLSF